MNAESRKEQMPEWLQQLLGLGFGEGEGAPMERHGRCFVIRDGILRDTTPDSTAQHQTRESFGFKWEQRASYESKASLERMRKWLLEKYGDPVQEGWLEGLERPALVLDAGCGAAMSGLEYWGSSLDQVHYLGVDISQAVVVARERCAKRGAVAGFIQSNLMTLPLPGQSVDIIFSEGVLHHTDSTREAFQSLCPLLREGGLFMFYVYRKKGPVREFTDDHLREKLQALSPEDGWEMMKPLTRLGEALGKLDVDVDVPEAVDLLGISAGRINVQRLFYQHFCKAFYHPDLSLEEMNHINFDWYAPVNAHRHTPEEVRQWCADAGLRIERECIEEAGITIVARKAE
ncbi:MAG: class I SAM-dependent methyltransferase [Verrucomicrobiota bacterium]|nr:class I SAM-dependent methyltransferase [Verrucomicrobiota bacterium]